MGDDSDSVYEDWERVTTRVGDRPARETRWFVSTDNEGTFAPDWAGDLLKEMLESDRFIAQITPYGANPITAVFNTAGLRNALAPLAETCGWTF